jgi:hypothetical protein
VKAGRSRISDGRLRVVVLFEGVNFQRVRDGVVVEHWTTVNLDPLRA